MCFFNPLVSAHLPFVQAGLNELSLEDTQESKREPSVEIRHHLALGVWPQGFYMWVLFLTKQ